MTGEHVFPDWLNKVLPDLKNRLDRHADKTTYEPDPLSEYWPTQQLGRKLTSWKVHIACGPCNNQWMNRLQTAARPSLTRMIRGEGFKLTSDEQAEVAKWAVMTCIVGEFTSRDPRARGWLPAADREHLLKVGRDDAPAEFPGWSVGIGRYVGSDDHPSYDHTFHEAGLEAPFGHSSTIVIGKLLIQGWRFLRDGTHRANKAGCEALGLTLIWPATAEPVQWPPANGIDDKVRDLLRAELRKCFDRLVSNDRARPLPKLLPRLSKCPCNSGRRYKDCHGRLT